MSTTYSAGGTERNFWAGVALALAIDLPFVVLLLTLRSGSPYLTLLLALLFLAVSGFLIAVSYQAQRMDYILYERDLVVDFGVSPLRLPYDRIVRAEVTRTSLRFRLFGGSWFGAYWGIFTTPNLGKAQVYSTRPSGEFVVLSLSDGTKVLLSPTRANDFAEEINRRAIAAYEQGVTEGHENRRGAFIQASVLILAWLALAAYIASVYPALPNIIPVHFGLDGLPNRWGNKSELLWLVAVALLFPGLDILFALKFSTYNRRLTIFVSAVFALAIALFAAVVYMIVQAAA